jgi:hypothetical protein
MGGAFWGELESGTTTTVRRNWLRILVVKTKHGRVFLISDPNVGSSCTHQTSPRLTSSRPWLGNFDGDGIEFPFYIPHLGVTICRITRMGEPVLALRQLFG